MDYDKLIEQLRAHTDGWTDTVYGYATLRLEAAAIEALRADLEQERAHRIHAEQHADAFLKDCERLDADLARVTAEMDAVVRNSIFIPTKKEDTP